MRMLLTATAVLLVAACSQQAPHASASPADSTVAAALSPTAASAPSASPTASPSPSPLPAYSPSPLPAGSPVARHTLAPATVLPVIALCSTPVTHTADGNAYPLRCRSGALNVTAWNFYAGLVPTTMALGYNPTVTRINAALCHDSVTMHDTGPELQYGYEMAAAYNGWNVVDMSQTTCR